MFDKKICNCKFGQIFLMKKKNFAVDPDWIWIQQSLDPDTDHDFAKCLHCKACLGEIEQYNYNVSLLALLWSFRNLGVKMWEEKFTKSEQ